MPRIPRIIHQTWKTNRVPKRFASFVHGWVHHHPGWRHILWTDRSSRQYVRGRYPALLPLYDAYDANIKRVDMFRYLVMLGIGGVYADLDVECLAPMQPLLDTGRTCILGLEPELHAQRLYGRARLVSNAVLASAAGHPFWTHVIGVMESCCREKDVLSATGPMMLTSAVDSFPAADVRLLPSAVWSPLVDLANSALNLTPTEREHFTGMRRRQAYPAESLAVHHWAGTWYSGGWPGALNRLWVKAVSRFRRR
ncbi:MAG: glycosyltransferase [Pseudomonadota bacterium]